MFSRCLDRERTTVPVAMALVTVGLTLIAISLGLSRAAALHAHFGKDGMDFVQGLLVGIGIALEIGALSVLAPLVRKKQRGE